MENRKCRRLNAPPSTAAARHRVVADAPAPSHEGTCSLCSDSQRGIGAEKPDVSLLGAIRIERER